MPTEAQRNKRLQKAQMRVLFHTPFFAVGVCKLPVVWDSSVPTACTDGKQIMWNPEFFDNLPDEQIVTVLCHEVAHCLLGHLWRAPVGANWDKWNEATDYQDNGMLREFGEACRARGTADPFPMPEGALVGKYIGLSEEETYYRILPPPGPGGSNSPTGTPTCPKAGAGAAQGAAGKPRTGQSGGQPGKTPPAPKGGQQQPSGQPQSQTPPSMGTFTRPKGTAAEAKKQAADWDGTLIQSVKAMGKERGNLPAGLQRYVQELVSPKVTWQEHLRTFLREQAADDWNFMKPNPYYDDGDFILPSLDSERMGPVIFAVDTSGSIDTELLRQFKSEMQGCLDEMKPSKLIEICCDAQITQEKEYRLGDRVSPEAPGGGGTCFEPVFARVEKFDPPPKCIVYLTDLYGSFPSEAPPYPVLWVTWGGKTDAPFGEVIPVK